MRMFAPQWFSVRMLPRPSAGIEPPERVAVVADPLLQYDNGVVRRVGPPTSRFSSKKVSRVLATR